jgi:hypothetical protein
MADKDINSLDRFRKQSPRLVLEEHSHCEVPAGCGGVVLRWRNPLAALPLVVHLYCPVKSTLFVDGKLVENTGVDLEPGPHVFAIVIEEIDLASGLFMFAALHDPQRAHKHMPPGVEEKGFQLISAADRTWRFLTEEPIEHAVPWTTLDFIDRDWPVLARVLPSPQVEWRQPGAYQAHWCNRHHAAFLALPKETKGKSGVWVRRKFVVPLPTTK